MIERIRYEFGAQVDFVEIADKINEIVDYLNAAAGSNRLEEAVLNMPRVKVLNHAAGGSFGEMIEESDHVEGDADE